MKKPPSVLWLILLVFPMLTVCSPTEKTQTVQQEIISRYDLITSEKISPDNDAHPPILHAGGWEEPQPISGTINSAGLEDSPFITPDGKTLFLFFTPSAETPAEKQIFDGVTGIYKAELFNGEWLELDQVDLSVDGQAVLDGCPFYQDGILWFCSIRAGNFRDIDIWQAEFTEQAWMNISNAGAILNESYQIGEMHLNLEGNIMYFHKPNPDQGGTYDLWQTEYNNGDWSKPITISALNTSENDSRPALSPDGSELWFTRTYMGTPAIYRSSWTADEWGAPELILSQFAGEPSVDAAGNIYFTHHFFQEGKMIEADIYLARKK